VFPGAYKFTKQKFDNTMNSVYLSLEKTKVFWGAEGIRRTSVQKNE